MFTILALMASSLTQSETPTPNVESPIVVQGTADRQKQIGDFIRQMTPTHVQGQLSRFDAKVCPLAVGLSREQNAIVAQRMRDVAQAASIPIGKTGCDPNIVVIVTPDKGALLKQLERRRMYLFPESWSLWTIHALEHSKAPAVAWSIEGARNADGQPLNSSGEVAINRTTRPGSRLTPAVVPYFTASVVVIQSDGLDGLTTTQLADYAAMRTFVSTDPAKLDPNTPSILKLLDTPMGQSVPLTMTAWDLSFLRSYYATRGVGYAGTQRSEIKSRMAHDLEQQLANQH